MIFISYRREDTKAVVTHLHQCLVARFGSERVFVDFDDIPVGVRWTDELREQLQASRVLLAVIGKKWGGARYPDDHPDLRKRDELRLKDPDDWVRIEICTAIERYKRNGNGSDKMHVAVVMIDGATLPNKVWDCELDELPGFQQEKLNNLSDFQAHVERLCQRLEEQAPELRRGRSGVVPEPESLRPHGRIDAERLVREYVSNEARAHARLQLPLVSESGHPVVAPIGELRIDLPMVVGHECGTRDPKVLLRWLGIAVLLIHDEFRASHTHALLVDRASRHEDIRRECTVVERLKPGARVVVVGDPGCGKSTLLQWICHHYAVRHSLRGAPGAATPNPDALPDHDWVPFLVLCRDFAGKPLPTTLADVLHNHLKVRQYDERIFESLVPEFERRLAGGQALLLIDGLDEIPDADDRIRFSRFLASLADRFPETPIVVTSRVVGFQAVREELAADFDHLVVGPLDRAARRAFLERWSRFIGLNDGKTAALLQQVCHTRALAKFTESILSLALVAQIQVIENELPTRKVDVYRRAFQWMLQRRRPFPGPTLTANELLPHLRFLAYSMRKTGRQRWSEVEVVSAFQEIRRLESEEPALRTRSPEELLKACIESLGVLNVAGTETDQKGYDRRMIQFFHQSFQEYFAGTAILYGHDSAGAEGPVAKLRNLLATLEIREREVRIHDGYMIAEPIIADYWQEAVRAAVAEMKPAEADEAILMMLPMPGMPPTEARARAVFALQCLADEPEVGRHTVEAVFAAMVENLHDDDGLNEKVNTGMDEAQAAVCESGFGERMIEHLLREYIRTSGEDRSRIGGPLAICLGRGELPIAPENADEAIARLQRGLTSKNQPERTRATLRFTYRCYRSDAGKLGFLSPAQQEIALTILANALEQDECTARSSLWALSWLTGVRNRFSGPKLADVPVSNPLADFVQIPATVARKVEVALHRADLEARAISYGCLVLTRERGLNPIFHQFDWTYELAVIADGARPRRGLPAPAPTCATTNLDWMRGLLRHEMPIRSATDIAVSLGSFGVFSAELIAPLKYLFTSRREHNNSRDEALVYLGLIGTPEAVPILIEAADTPPVGDDDYFYSRGLFGLLLLDDVDVFAGQIRKALPHSEFDIYAYGLAGSRDPRGLELLNSFRDHPDERIRTAVRKAYARPWMNSK